MVAGAGKGYDKTRGYWQGTEEGYATDRTKGKSYYGAFGLPDNADKLFLEGDGGRGGKAAEKCEDSYPAGRENRV